MNVTLGHNEIVIFVAGNDPVSAITVQHVSEPGSDKPQDQPRTIGNRAHPEASQPSESILVCQISETFNKLSKCIETHGDNLRTQDFREEN